MTLSSERRGDLRLILRLKRIESYSKEERKARNRLTAKRSRDRRNAYIQHLETSLRLANERTMELERRIESMEKAQQSEDADVLYFLSNALNTDVY